MRRQGATARGTGNNKGGSKRDPFPHSHLGREQRASAGKRDLSALLRRVLQKAGGLQNRALQETGGLKHRALRAEETKRRESARLPDTEHRDAKSAEGGRYIGKSEQRDGGCEGGPWRAEALCGCEGLVTIKLRSNTDIFWQ